MNGFTPAPGAAMIARDVADNDNSLIVERGWFSVVINRVQATYMDARVDDASYARYLDALARDIARAPDNERRGILYETPDPGTSTAERRKRLGQILTTHRDKLARVTAGYVLATPSALARGLLTAVFWVAPPPYPNDVVATTAEGFEWLALRLPGLNAKACEQTYQKIRESCLVRMGP